VLGGLTSPSDLADLEKICGQRRVRRVSTHRGSGGRNGRDHSRTISWESEAVLRADQIRTLQAGMALLLWSRLPPVLVHLPLLSEQPDWQQVREEEEQARLANDRARAAAGPRKRPGYYGEMFPDVAAFPGGPLLGPLDLPGPSPIN